MGLFDFLKNIGKKVPDEAAMAAGLQKSVEGMGLDIIGLHVAFDDGLATIRGEAGTQKDLELARLVVGNHQGVQKVNDDGLKLRAQTVASAPTSTAAVSPGVGGVVSAASGATAARMYTVKSGDTLSKIARETLGEANRYSAIFEANKPMIKDPDEIYPGQVLRIPAGSEARV